MSALSLSLSNVGKKFGKEWIFKDLNLSIKEGEKVVILGGNGSGKSTLLQAISGYITLSEGEISYKIADQEYKIEEVQKMISFASPYLQLIEDFTLDEMILHAAKFKPFLNGISTTDVRRISGLELASDKYIKQFSSGMKQRLKLTLALLADTPLVLLDEPISNLDENAINWYKQMINDHCKDRTVIVCSNNIQDEFYFCKEKINVQDYKQVKQL